MITLHALAAVINFVTGLAMLSPGRSRKHTRLMPVFLVSLVGLIVFMLSATVSHWGEITTVERIVFSGLPFLGLYMLYRAVHARNLLLKQQDAGKYVDDIGFILISLFNGFTIVALLDLGAPGWVVGIGAVAATLVGSQAIKRAKKGLAAK